MDLITRLSNRIKKAAEAKDPDMLLLVEAGTEILALSSLLHAFEDAAEIDHPGLRLLGWNRSKLDRAFVMTMEYWATSTRNSKLDN